MTLPANYAWLNDVGPLPRTIQEGLKLLGTVEVVGRGSNRTIIDWRDELNAAAGVSPYAVKIVGFSDDDIPWCGLFTAVVAFRAAKVVVDSPLWARNWLRFGNPVREPMLGDVLVFTRPGGGGHVGFYIGEDRTHYHVLGGNQKNRVSIARIEKGRLIGARMPHYINAPASRTKRQLEAIGAVTTNEA